MESRVARRTEDRAASTRALLAPQAMAFAERRHDGQRRESDGAPFMHHLREVAALLRRAGGSDALIAAGLLHDVVEGTDTSVAELQERFGFEVAELVRTVTDDAMGTYSQRKHALREQVRSAGGDAALLFAADKISKVRELSEQARHDRAGAGEAGPPSSAQTRRERCEQLRLDHYRASLTMLQGIAPRHPLTCGSSASSPPAVRTSAPLDAAPPEPARGTSCGDRRVFRS